MPKTDVHVKLDPVLIAAVKQYAAGQGINFTAALSTLTARGLRDEGIIIGGDGSNDLEQD